MVENIVSKNTVEPILLSINNCSTNCNNTRPNNNFLIHKDHKLNQSDTAISKENNVTSFTDFSCSNKCSSTTQSSNSHLDLKMQNSNLSKVKTVKTLNNLNLNTEGNLSFKLIEDVTEEKMDDKLLYFTFPIMLNEESKQSKKKEEAENGKRQIKRPMNAFMLYAKKMRRMYKNIDSRQVAVKLGKMWKDLSKDEKAIYYNEASSLKFKHQCDNPGYVFSPLTKKKKSIKMMEESAYYNESSFHSIIVSPSENNSYIPTTIDNNVDDDSINKLDKMETNESIKFCKEKNNEIQTDFEKANHEAVLFCSDYIDYDYSVESNHKDDLNFNLFKSNFKNKLSCNIKPISIDDPKNFKSNVFLRNPHETNSMQMPQSVNQTLNISISKISNISRHSNDSNIPRCISSSMLRTPHTLTHLNTLIPTYEHTQINKNQLNSVLSQSHKLDFVSTNLDYFLPKTKTLLANEISTRQSTFMQPIVALHNKTLIKKSLDNQSFTNKISSKLTWAKPIVTPKLTTQQDTWPPGNFLYKKPILKGHYKSSECYFNNSFKADNEMNLLPDQYKKDSSIEKRLTLNNQSCVTFSQPTPIVVFHEPPNSCSLIQKNQSCVNKLKNIDEDDRDSAIEKNVTLNSQSSGTISQPKSIVVFHEPLNTGSSLQKNISNSISTNMSIVKKSNKLNDFPKRVCLDLNNNIKTDLFLSQNVESLIANNLALYSIADDKCNSTFVTNSLPCLNMDSNIAINDNSTPNINTISSKNNITLQNIQPISLDSSNQILFNNRLITDQKNKSLVKTAKIVLHDCLLSQATNKDIRKTDEKLNVVNHNLNKNLFKDQDKKCSIKVHKLLETDIVNSKL